MFKKLILVSSILALSTGAAFAAAGPYVGGSIGVNSGQFKLQGNTVGTTENNVDLGGRGALANLFAGYGVVVSQNIYLGGEVFANLTNTEADVAIDGEKYSFKNKYGYGISFIPGVLISDSTMVYGRVGLVRSRFEGKASIPGTTATTIDKTLTGGQLGLGIQTRLTQNIDLRGEYDYTSYTTASFGPKVQPRTDTYTVGLVYKFD